jgi:ribosomal protein S24E
MNIKIEEKINEPLFERTKIKFLVEFDGPIPTREQIRQSLITILAATPNTLVLQPLRSFCGKRLIKATANLYQNEKAPLKYEKKYILIRNKIIQKEEKQQQEQKTQKNKT